MQRRQQQLGQRQRRGCSSIIEYCIGVVSFLLVVVGTSTSFLLSTTRPHITMISSLFIKTQQKGIHRSHYSHHVVHSLSSMPMLSTICQQQYNINSGSMIDLISTPCMPPVLQVHYRYVNNINEVLRTTIRTFITATFVIQSPKRPPDTNKLLTRTMVRNMRKADLEIELQHRGINVFNDSRSKNIKRTDLIQKLLDIISKEPNPSQPVVKSQKPSSSSISPSTTIAAAISPSPPTIKTRFRNPPPSAEEKLEKEKILMSIRRFKLWKETRRKERALNRHLARRALFESQMALDDDCVSDPIATNDEVDTNIEIDSTSTIDINENDTSSTPWEKRYSIDNYKKFKSNKSYSIIAVATSSPSSNNGIGMGIILRELDKKKDSNGKIVWQTQVYYPKCRSLYEANYCAVIIAIRHAIQLFHISKIEFYVYDYTLHDQIMGIFPISKPSLRTLHEQISNLINEYNLQKTITWCIASADQRHEAMVLAQNALHEKTSRNLGDVYDTNLSIDPMDEETISRGGQKKKRDTSEYDLKFQEMLHPNDVVIDPTITYVLRYDGGSRGNPGVAGAGMVLYDDQKREIWYGWKFLGHNVSNNLAEYTAISLGLEHALFMGIERVRVEGDSLLVCKQLLGEYQVKSENLRSKFSEAKLLMKKFQSCTVHHIRREYNKRADELANEAMTTKKVYGLQDAA